MTWPLGLDENDVTQILTLFCSPAFVGLRRTAALTGSSAMLGLCA